MTWNKVVCDVGGTSDVWRLLGDLINNCWRSLDGGDTPGGIIVSWSHGEERVYTSNMYFIPPILLISPQYGVYPPQNGLYILQNDIYPPQNGIYFPNMEFIPPMGRDVCVERWGK